MERLLAVRQVINMQTRANEKLVICIEKLRVERADAGALQGCSGLSRGQDVPQHSSWVRFGARRPVGAGMVAFGPLAALTGCWCLLPSRDFTARLPCTLASRWDLWARCQWWCRRSSPQPLSPAHARHRSSHHQKETKSCLRVVRGPFSF